MLGVEPVLQVNLCRANQVVPDGPEIIVHHRHSEGVVFWQRPLELHHGAKDRIEVVLDAGLSRILFVSLVEGHFEVRIG